MKHIYLISLLLSSFSVVVLANEELLSGLEPFCLYNSTVSQLFCSNFTSFSQLLFNLTNKQFSNVIIEVKKDLDLSLDSTLDLNGLKMNSSVGSGANPKITLVNLKGLDPLWKSFQRIKLLNEQRIFDLEIKNCDWNFNYFDCSFQKENTLNSIFLFSDLNIDNFIVKYPKFYLNSPVCPIIFKKTRVNNWIFESLNPIYFKKPSTNLNDLAGHLDIRVTRLECVFGYGQFVKFLNEETLLDILIFNQLESLTFRHTYIEMIDGISLGKLTKLKSLKLLSYDITSLISNGVDWVNNLNEGSSLTLEINRFKFEDSDFCKFKNFPQDKLILLGLAYSGENFEIELPCTCTIYYVYKNFKLYENLLVNGSVDAYYPFHCFNVNEILLQEQLNYCNDEFVMDDCNKNKTTTTQALKLNMTTIQKQCLPNEAYCSCSSLSSIKILECADTRIKKIPNDFFTEFSLNYVSFVGSSIKSVPTNSFKNLRLEENATIIVSGIEEFESDLFLNDTLYTKKLVFVIEKSLLSSLILKYPFRKTNFSRLELNDCQVETGLSIRAFEGSRIDVFSINGASTNSSLLTFKTFFMYEEPVIRKFKLANIFNLFKEISPGNLFGLDSSLINIALFRYIEELEIVNTWLDYIDSEFLTLLEHLKTLRFENVNLKNIIDYSSFYDGASLNWVANENVERIYLGREMYSPGKFDFQNEYACYFSDLRNKTSVYIYDTIDDANGIKCSCTIYWLYYGLDFSNVNKLADLAYVPLCIKNLNSAQNLKIKLNDCFGTTDLKSFCEDAINSTSTPSFNSTTYFSNSANYTVSLVNNSTMVSSTISSNNLDQNNIFIVLVVIAGLMAAIVVLLIVSILVKCCFKKESKKYEESYELNEEKISKI